MKKLKTARERKTKTNPACPECGSNKVVPTIHGIPSPTQAKAVKQGKAILADREEWEGMTEWYCKSCGCDWGKHSRRFKRAGGVNATRSD